MFLSRRVSTWICTQLSSGFPPRWSQRSSWLPVALSVRPHSDHQSVCFHYNGLSVHSDVTEEVFTLELCYWLNWRNLQESVWPSGREHTWSLFNHFAVSWATCDEDDGDRGDSSVSSGHFMNCWGLWGLAGFLFRDSFRGFKGCFPTVPAVFQGTLVVCRGFRSL